MSICLTLLALQVIQSPIDCESATVCDMAQELQIPDLAKQALCAEVGVSWNNIETFIGGVFRGIQKDPAVRSACVQEILNVGTATGQVVSAVGTLIHSRYPPDGITVAFEISEMSNYVVFSIEQCHLRVLTNRIRDIIFTLEGKVFFIGLIALNYQEILQHYSDISAALNVGDILLGGYYLGVIFKIIFDYSF